LNEITPLLVVRAQTGDRVALNQLLEFLQAPLYAHIVGVLGREDGADDVLQDVLLIVARKIGSVREPKWARAWAYRIANREAVRAARKDRRYRDVVENEYVAEETTPEDVFSAELRSQLPTLLATLPPAAGQVVRLHYLDELTLTEIAEALEVPLGTVKSRLSYGLRALRQAI
jgi:RNA polymerase sigma-70 factor, ECF subfamily